jgi:hypothetical protein
MTDRHELRPPPDTVGEYDECGQMLPTSTGAIVFDARGGILLCKPINSPGGYIWTFPKGMTTRHCNHGPEQAVVVARQRGGIEGMGRHGRIPYKFRGEVTTTVFYFVEVRHDHGDFDRSIIERVVWATQDEARGLLSQSTTEVGRRRDLAVLDQAYRWRPGGETNP